MNSMQPASGQGSSTEKSEPTRHLDSIAWAAFFIWIGIAMLVAIPWGWFLVGLGILILAAQLARSQMNIKIEGFWVACGSGIPMEAKICAANAASDRLLPTRRCRTSAARRA